MLSAGGVWGRQVGEGKQERAQRQRTCEGASHVTMGKREGAADQEAEPSLAGLLVLPAAGPQVGLLQMFFLESIFPLPTLQLAQHGFLIKFSFQEHKETTV